MTIAVEAPAVADDVWRSRAAALAAELADDGAIRSPEWRVAFTDVPRHVFVPRFFRRDETGELVAIAGSDPERRSEWLDAVYADESLTTQLGQIDTGYTLRPLTVAASSSSGPSLMARMLADLDVHSGHQVLEVGAGTGYNAALLCHRLGDGAVFSVDIHPGLVDAARARLARLGYRPTLKVVDGRVGWPEHAPFDRIIATCGVSTIPHSWVTQTRPGGVILSDTSAGRGMMARLVVGEDGTAAGPFLDYPGRFMAMRHGAAGFDRPAELPPEHLHGARRDSTDLDPGELADPAFAFFLQLHLGSGRSSHYKIDERSVATVVARNGSWAEVTGQTGGGGSTVRFDGTHNPWETAESAYAHWLALGRPKPQDFGLAVTSRGQHVWHRDPEGDWSIDLTG